MKFSIFRGDYSDDLDLKTFYWRKTRSQNTFFFANHRFFLSSATETRIVMYDVQLLSNADFSRCMTQVHIWQAWSEGELWHVKRE